MPVPRRRTGVALAAALAWLVPSAAAAHVEPQAAEPTTAPAVSSAEASLGPSGLPPTPPAERGGELPLEPSRIVAFSVEEGTALQLDLSPDGRTLVFGMLGDIYRLDASGGEATALTRGLAMDTQPVFSPDGNWIAFLSDRSGAENVWVMRANGSDARQVGLYADDPIFTSPAWSHDGRSIYVSRYWPDRNAYELWRFAALDSGMGEVVLPTYAEAGNGEPQQALGAVASPDGRWIYYAARSGSLDLAEPVEWRIVRRDLATGETETLVHAVGDIRLGDVQSSAFRPVLSHNGELLAFVQRRVGATWLRLLDLGTGRQRDLARLDPDSLQASYWSDIAPLFAFTPDDGALIYTEGGKIRRLSLAGGSGPETIPFRARVEAELGPLSRAPTRVETGPVVARIVQSPALSPDGRWFAFSALGRIHVMDAEGGEVRAVAPGGPPQFHPSWSADGTRLLFVSWTARDGGAVWEVSSSGGEPRRISDGSGFFTHPVYAPDGSVVAVRSPTDDRVNSYVEFGQFRDAQLVRLVVGAQPEVLATGSMGGTPHFLADGTLLINRPDGVYRVIGEERVVSVAGPNWYFAEGPAQADDIRVSPDGRHALAQIAQQLHLVQLPGGSEAAINLSLDPPGHEKLTSEGADFFGWSADGRTVFWSVGSTLYRRELAGGPVRHSVARVAVRRDVPQGELLLSGATVLTMGPVGTIEDAEILVSGDRIAAIGPRGSLAVPDGVSRRDVSGSFIIPGLIDVHDHVADIRRDVLDFEAWGPAANLAYGVTSVFDPSTLTIDMLAYQDAIDAGMTPGSRIFSTGTAIFGFNDFRTPEEVAAVLRRYRDHYRLTNVKMYRSGNRKVRQWFVEEARKLGLQPTTEGALALKLDLTHILDGYSGNEHAIPPPILYEDVVQLLARSGTSYDLTLQITHGGSPAQDYFIARDAPHDDPKYARFAPGWFRDQKFWQREWRDPDGYLFTEVARSAAKVARAGGLVAIGAHGEVPGLGTHWEMEAHAMGGWTPAEILEAATIGGARAIGRDADLGSLESGKLADLVVLRSDPRLDIRNARDIASVMKGGRLHDGETLAELWPNVVPAPEFWFSPGDLPAGE